MGADEGVLSVGAAHGGLGLRAGALHGRAREWHRNGQLAEDGEYEYGITLWAKQWDENGVLEEDYTLTESESDHRTLLHFRALHGGASWP
ncbi:hypothetical protein SAMN05660976_04605 [Nonomuraea pusilla]|uniref:Uncharacterized protein n=1 Tax=Nonomuraea pusilla TaxID=46177 RepID=A0A1H7WUH2_9ACTN|nr:hypothetical protein SAMN05660976_04605 [Nonomuraea pusilla]